MAYTPLTPVNMNVSMKSGLSQNFQSPVVQTPAGAAIDLSAWVSLTATAIPQSPNPTSAPVNFGTVTAASTGVVTLTTSATDLAANGSGTCALVISGKPTSGDAAQLLVQGTLSVAQG